MKIYEFGHKNGQAYIYAPPQVADPCLPDPPRSLAAGWSSPTFELIQHDEFRSFLPKTDFPTFTIATAVLSERAVERLRPILLPCGEILPLRLSNDRDLLYLFNVTRVIDAIDMKRSEFMRFPDGRIMHSTRLVFDPAKIPRDAFFFKSIQMGAVTEIFAIEAAVAAVKKARLTGYEFRVAWTDE